MTKHGNLFIVTESTIDNAIARRRYPLAAVRAMAALPVLVFHAYQISRYGEDARWPLEGIWHQLLMASPMGVDLFFVVSAFLLSLPYVTAVLGGPRRSGRVVLLRRATRLLPLYFLTVLLVWGLTNPTLPGDWLDLLLHLTFTHVFSDEKIFYTNGPAWSLAVEIHFYLLLVLLGWLAQRWLTGLTSRRRKLAFMYGAIGLLILASNAYKFWAVYVVRAGYEQWSYWFNLAAKLDVFGIGLGFAVLVASGTQLRTRFAQYAVGLAGASVILFAVLTQPLGRTITTWWHPMFALGAVLAMAAAIMTTRPPTRILTWRPLVWVGTVSYSLYLWQEPVLRLINSAGLLPPLGRPETFPVITVLLLGCSLFMAWISYWLIEQAGLKLQAAYDHEGRPRDYYAPQEA